MATYNSLTQENKDKLAVFTTLLRGYYGELARFLDGVDDAAIHYTANGIGAILNNLDAGAQVPNASGLAGSQALTKEELQAAVANMAALLTTYYAAGKRQVYDKMVGPLNTSRG